MDPFVGIVALSLAALAIAACWKDWRVRLLGAVAVGGLVYSLGPFSVFQGALYALIPELDKARTPGVATALFGFGVAVLAAFGLDRWREGDPTPWTRKIALCAAGFGILTGFACLVVLFYNKLSWQGDMRPPLVIFIALALALLLSAGAAGNLSKKSAGVLAALLLVFELYQGSSSSAAFAVRADNTRDRYMLDVTGNADIAGFLHGRQGIQRTEVPNEAFLANWGAYYDVPVWEGYLASVTTNVLDFESHTVNARRFWGVAYQVATAPTPYASQQIFKGASGMKVFWQPDAFPRAWAVHSLIRIQSHHQVNWYVANHLDDLHSEALIYDAPPALAPCANPKDDVQLKEDQGSRVGVSVNVNCASMVVVSDASYPGWRAYVDGTLAPIYQVNGAMRGVLVGAGRHSRTMRFRPPVVYGGAALSLIGIIGAIVLARSKRV